MSKDEKYDILFDIDMKIYDKFNDKLCKMNEHLGDFYSYKDIDDLEKYMKDTEIKLLRQAVGKQQKEIENLKQIEQEHQKINGELREEIYKLKDELEDTIFRKYETIADIETDYSVPKSKIEEKIKEIKEREKIYLYANEFEIVNRLNVAENILKSLLESED